MTHSMVVMLYPSTGSASLYNPYLVNLDRIARTARSLGFGTAAIAPPESFVPAGIVDHLYRLPSSSRNFDDLSALVEKIDARSTVARVYPLQESLVIAASLLRDMHDIPGMRPKQAWAFRNKNVMHQKAKNAGLKVPSSIRPTTFQDLDDFAKKVGLPVVVKPVAGSGSRQTMILRDRSDLHTAWMMIAHGQTTFRAEEFIPTHGAGGQYHCDCLVRGGEILFSLLSRYTKPPIDFHDEIPVGTRTRRHRLTQGELEILREHKKLLHAFQVDTGVFHTEFFLTPDQQVYLGETAARIGGGMIVPMLEHATGVNLAETWVRMELDPAYHPVVKNGPEFGGEFLISQAQGRIRAMTSAEELLRIPNVVDAALWMEEGDLFAPERSTQMIGYVVFLARGQEEITITTTMVRERFRVQTSPITPLRAANA